MCAYMLDHEHVGSVPKTCTYNVFHTCCSCMCAYMLDHEHGSGTLPCIMLGVSAGLCAVCAVYLPSLLMGMHVMYIK